MMRFGPAMQGNAGKNPTPHVCTTAADVPPPVMHRLTGQRHVCRHKCTEKANHSNTLTDAPAYHTHTRRETETRHIAATEGMHRLYQPTQSTKSTVVKLPDRTPTHECTCCACHAAGMLVCVHRVCCGTRQATQCRQSCSSPPSSQFPLASHPPTAATAKVAMPQAGRQLA